MDVRLRRSALKQAVAAMADHVVSRFADTHADEMERGTQKMRWWITQDKGGQWVIAGRYRVAALARIAVAVALCSVVVVLSYRTVRGSALEVFRPSEPVKNVAAYKPDSRLARYMADNPDACGVSAPNLRIYDQLVLLRVHGLPTFMYNPVYYIIPDTSTDSMIEISLMCPEGDKGFLTARPTAIHVHFQDSYGSDSNTELSGMSARCLMHHTDVLQGSWPCNSTQANERVPCVLENVPSLKHRH